LVDDYINSKILGTSRLSYVRQNVQTLLCFAQVTAFSNGTKSLHDFFVPTYDQKLSVNLSVPLERHAEGETVSVQVLQDVLPLNVPNVWL